MSKVYELNTYRPNPENFKTKKSRPYIVTFTKNLIPYLESRFWMNNPGSEQASIYDVGVILIVLTFT
jgi:hypothetical protein